MDVQSADCWIGSTRSYHSSICTMHWNMIEIGEMFEKNISFLDSVGCRDVELQDSKQYSQNITYFSLSCVHITDVLMSTMYYLLTSLCLHSRRTARLRGMTWATPPCSGRGRASWMRHPIIAKGRS